MAAMVGIVLVVILTLVQVMYLIDFRELLKLKPNEAIPDNTFAVNLALRLFAWIVTGVLIWLLMYGKGDRAGARDPKTRSLGLALSAVNLVIWAGITFWYFSNLHGR
jgi:Na+/phosphate symporter